MTITYFKFPLSFLLLFFFIFSCKKKESGKAEIITPVQIGKITSLKTNPGRNRVKLTWNLPENTTLQKCRVYVDVTKDSLDVSLNAAPGIMEVHVNNLEEGDHVFSVAVLDAKGNSSEKVSVSEHVYGNAYEKSLADRGIKDVIFNESAGSVIITWDNPVTTIIGTQIKYTDALSNLKNLTESQASASTTLINFRKGDSLQYRTLYQPERAIDTFYTVYKTVNVKIAIEDTYKSMVTLEADGPGNTYELIGSVLGGSPSRFVNESPDCAHPAGQQERHIWEEFDPQLNKNVFVFELHVTPDGDLCTVIDRQRNEIKTFGPSPNNVKAFNGDEMIFKWKFKLPAGFKPSTAFTHIHQIKAGDGTNDGSPLITITPRYGTPNKLEIIHTGNTTASDLGKVKIVDLAPFEGTWVEATEKIKFGPNGTYDLVLKRVSDGVVLLSYTSNKMDLWRDDATFIRPKWGIYRSLNDAGKLRDEKVWFADFMIGKK
jgi:hypothetical protein